MAPNNITAFNTLRAKSYVFRLPLFTRSVIVGIILLALLSLGPFWNLQELGALIPSKVSIFNAYRITTFPLIHLNLIHAILNILALTPLLERFELEHGTLLTVSLFFGREFHSTPSVGCRW
jgi:membrane associated rhomboid family serine protease